MQKRASSIRMAAAAVALAASTGACGGSSQSAPPNCLQVAPCGGDVVGTWTFLGVCTDVAALSGELVGCPGAAFNAFGVSLTGTFTFNADATYTATNWHETFASTQTIPLQCAGGASCAEGNGTESETTPGSTTTITTTCTGTSTCTCSTTGELTVSSDLGSWTTAGTMLTMDGPATATTLSYCVEENRLHFIGLRTTSTGQSSMVSDIVAVRSQ